MHEVCIPWDTRVCISRMGAARVKQEEEADTNIIAKRSKKYGRKESGCYKGEES